jgi:hypothetical protein
MALYSKNIEGIYKTVTKDGKKEESYVKARLLPELTQGNHSLINAKSNIRPLPFFLAETTKHIRWV